MMNLKETLCEIVVIIKESRGLTYKQITELSDGLVNDTQINNILRHKGREVTCDRIYDLLEKLGVKVNISFEE